MSFIGKNISINTLKANGLSAAPAAPSEGMIYYDDGTTNTEGLYIYRNSAWEFVGTKLDSQKLNPLAADPTTPIEGQFFYSDGTSRSAGLYVYDGTQWKTVGSGSSGINYIENTDAEGGITNWSTYADLPGSIPIDGTGGSPVITLAASSSDPLRGTKSFLITKLGVDLQGNGISTDFSIDTADNGQLAEVSFDYSMSEDYVTDDIKVFLYDVTNSRLINLTEAGLEAKSPSGKFKAFGTFPGSSTNLRLIVHLSSDSASAYTVKIDNVKVGPADSKLLANNNDIYFLGRGSTTGSITSDVTPIGFTTVTDTHNAYSTDTFTAPESGYYLFDVSIRLGSADDAATRIFINGTASVKIVNHIIESTSSEVGSATLELQAGDQVTFIKGSGDNTISDDTSNTWLSIIKVGKSLNESDASGRTVYVLGRGSTTGSVTSDVTPIGFTEITDTHGAWSGDTFSTPEGGIYSISSGVRLGTADDGAIDIYKNGTRTQRLTSTIVENSSGEVGSATIELQKGDEIQLRKGSGSNTIDNDTINTWINITKVADLPNVIQPNFIKFQTKAMTSDLSSDGDIASLQFNNLEIGKTYRISGQAMFANTNTTADNMELRFNSASGGGGTVYGLIGEYFGGPSGTKNRIQSINLVFTAVSTSLYFRGNSISSGTFIRGNGQTTETVITLEELRNFTEVDTF